MVEVVFDPVQLKAVGDALTRLEAENFIRPELPVYDKQVVEIMQPYPPAGFRAPHRGRGFLSKKQFWYVLLRELTMPEKKPSGYKRTGEYGRQWRASVVGLDAHIENLAEYAGYVGGLDASPGGKGKGKGNQPFTWRYGWKRLKQVADEVMDEWIPMMEHKAFRLWNRP